MFWPNPGFLAAASMRFATLAHGAAHTFLIDVLAADGGAALFPPTLGSYSTERH